MQCIFNLKFLHSMNKNSVKKLYKNIDINFAKRSGKIRVFEKKSGNLTKFKKRQILSFKLLSLFTSSLFSKAFKW